MSVTKKNITNRLYLVSLLLIVVVFSVIFKLIDLQFFQGDHYINISEEREFKNIEIPANRGNIYSDSGKLLASSVPKYNIRFDAVAPSPSSVVRRDSHRSRRCRRGPWGSGRRASPRSSSITRKWRVLYFKFNPNPQTTPPRASFIHNS